MGLSRWVIVTSCLIFMQKNGFALPKNPQLIEGGASIQSTHHECLIEATDRSIIHWDEFSIASGEAVRFTLPSAEAAVLNRVVGGNPSKLFGQLHSNGSIYLINPHGIIIGKEGLINVGSLLASTLDVSNRDFLEGKGLVFSSELKGTIENWGEVTAEHGDLVFLGEQIKNEGSLFASRGMILMGAGREITYFPYGNEKIQITLRSRDKTGEEPTGIVQKGTLHAKNIELKADGNLYSYAIRNEGIVEAGTIENREGRIYLVAEGGTASHTGLMKAQEVRILGQHVQVEEEATIDVSSPLRAGTILLGGDFQGNNPEILNATTTFVGRDVVLTADATQQGDGGKVILWADGITSYYGKVNARGGPQGGDGGFVEVSGKKNIDFQGLVDTTAPLGKTGRLLLDPTNITISAAATSNLTPTICPGPYTTITTPGVAANVNNAQLVTNLGTCNVTIFTSATAGGAQAGTITVSSPVVWTSDNSLTLTANSGITVSADITNTSNAASLTLTSGTTASSTLTISAGAIVSLTGSGVGPTGTLTLTSNGVTTSDMTISGAVSATDKALTISCADDFTLTAGTGSIAFNSPGKTFSYSTTAAANSISNFNGPVTITDGNTTFTTVGTLNFNNSFSTAGTGTITINSSGAVATATAGTTTHGSSGTFTLSSTAASSITLGRPFVQAGGAVTINGGTTLAINGGFTNSSTSSATTLKSGTIAAGTLSQAAATTISSTSTGALTLSANTTLGSDITLSGALSITGSDLNILLDDDFTETVAVGSITFNSPGKTFTYTSGSVASSISNFNGPLNITNGNLTMTAGTLNFNDSFTTAGSGNIAINAGAAVTTGTAGTTTHGSSGTFTLSSTAASSITLGRPFVQTGGAVTINAGTGLTINGGYTNNTASSTTTLKSGQIATGTVTFGAASPLVYGSTGDLLLQSGNGGDININNSVTITSANATFSPSDDFTLGATGTIAYSAVGKDLTFTAGPSTTHTFSGALTVTGGDLSITSFDDIVISAPTGQILYNVVGGTCQLIATGGGDPDVTINGLLNFQNGTLSMSGVDDIVSAAGSTFIHNAPTTAILSASSAISLGGVTTVSNGSISMTAGTGISIPTTGTFTWTSTGTLDMTTTTPAATSTVALAGTVAYSGGAWNIDSQGSVSITGFGVGFTYNPPGALSPFTVLSRLGNITINRSMTFTTPSAFSLSTLVGDLIIPEGTITNTLTGPWTFSVGNDFFLGDQDSVNLVQVGSAGGAMQITVGDEMQVISSSTTAGANALLGFSSGGQHPDMTINVGAGLRVEAYQDQEASIRSPGALTMTIGGDMVMIGNHLAGGVGQAVVSSFSDLTAYADNIILIGSPGGQLVHVYTLTGNLLFVAQKSISAVFDVRIHNQGAGSLTLVVDEQAPLPPSIGSGQLNFFGDAILETDGGPISLFAAIPAQTNLPAVINGMPASVGTTVFGVWYSTFSGTGSFPYTIFYKAAVLPPVTPPAAVTAKAFHKLAFASAQVNQQMLERTMGWQWRTSFNECNTECLLDTHPLYQRIPFEYPLFVDEAECSCSLR